jgi:hypothetical protein
VTFNLMFVSFVRVFMVVLNRDCRLGHSLFFLLFELFLKITIQIALLVLQMFAMLLVILLNVKEASEGVSRSRRLSQISRSRGNSRITPTNTPGSSRQNSAADTDSKQVNSSDSYNTAHQDPNIKAVISL